MNKYISELKEINNIIKRINEILKYDKKNIQKYLPLEVISKNKYYEIESLYIKLSREEKTEVLKLSKELLEKMHTTIFKSNSLCIKFYLDFKENKSLFERLSEIHKEPRWIPVDQVKMIHKKGNLTPSDKVNECEKMDYCLPNNPLRCNKFLSKSRYGCHDCLVDYCSVQDEWEPISYEDYNDILNERKENKSYKKLDSLFKK